MNVKLVINGYNALPYVAEGGIEQSEVYRQQSSMIALDGTLWQSEIVKRGLSISMREMRDANWRALCKALASRPVSVEYVDDAKGDRTALFYVTSVSAGTKRNANGLTWYSGASISLEER